MRRSITESEPPGWPDGLVPDEFDADRDAAAFHAAEQEAFADHWEFQPRDLSRWRELHVETDVAGRCDVDLLGAERMVVSGEAARTGRVVESRTAAAPLAVS